MPGPTTWRAVSSASAVRRPSGPSTATVAGWCRCPRRSGPASSSSGSPRAVRSTSTTGSAILSHYSKGLGSPGAITTPHGCYPGRTGRSQLTGTSRDTTSPRCTRRRSTRPTCRILPRSTAGVRTNATRSRCGPLPRRPRRHPRRGTRRPASVRSSGCFPGWLFPGVGASRSRCPSCCPAAPPRSPVPSR